MSLTTTMLSPSVTSPNCPAQPLANHNPLRQFALRRASVTIDLVAIITGFEFAALAIAANAAAIDGTVIVVT